MIKKYIRSSPYTVSIAVLFAAFLLNVAIGAVSIEPGTTFKIIANLFPGIEFGIDWPSYIEAILVEIRLPHAILMMLAGAALASSGAAYQGLFRNPLADPYLIGVASGGGLGAVIAMSISWPNSIISYLIIPLAAFVGAFTTVLIVYFLAKVGKMVPLTTLILAGIAVSAFNSAITSFLMLKSEEQIHKAVAFLLGGSAMSGWKPVLGVLPYLLVGFVLLILAGHSLNLLQFGEEQAKQLGLSVEKAKIFVIVTASLVTAGAVAFAGIIGFIGLIVPHVIRIVWGADYRQLIPLSLITGATALLLADLAGRILLAPQLVPVGIITALVGTPFFLWILRSAKSKVFW